MNKPIAKASAIVRGLLRFGVLCLLLLLPTYALAIPTANVSSDGMTAGIDGMGDACANVSDALGCYRSVAASQSSAKTDDGRSTPAGPAKSPRAGAQQEAPGEFQLFVAASVGRMLPLYGHSLFVDAPSTFSPADNIPVTPDYMIGPGDELMIRGWGQVDFDLSVTVDRDGSIYLPKVGNVNVSGIRFQSLQGYLKKTIGKIFQNFDLNVALGKLRSIQVFVVGQARRPGVYTVSSLSTLVNTLFASGGPSSRGSLRRVQVKRNGIVASELDMYDFLLKGDKTKDIPLLPGDVIYIPPVGQLAAISGSINNPAIYELKSGKSTLAELIELAGGLTTMADGDKVRVERIDNRKMRKVEEFPLDKAGLQRPLKDGDMVQVEVISGQFDNAVTLRGNVANPGRYPWREGMRVKDLIPDMDALIVPEYWAMQTSLPRVDIGSEKRLRTEIRRNESEINWDYALIERLNKNDLNTSLIPFSLGKALAGNDDENNLPLQQGDVITIFSKDDIQVPAAKRSVYVTLEGEFNQAGVYKVKPGETLRELIDRVGGLTPNAYLFAAEFRRESVRANQQKKLEEMADRMAEDIERNLAAKAQTALTKEDMEASRAQAVGQRALLARMRQVKATGRIVLPMSLDKEQAIPDMVLEDGDRFVVPQQMSTVSVMGMVYNENAFMHQKDKRVADYLELAGGPTRDADESRTYILRADGSVLSAQSTGAFFGGLERQPMMPGDAVVVPELLDKFSLTRELKDWAQVFYQFALGVGAINLLRL